MTDNRPASRKIPGPPNLDQAPSTQSGRAWAGIAALALCGLLAGCQSRAAVNAKAAASHAHWATTTLVKTTRTAANKTVDLARRASREIPSWHEVRTGETLLKIAELYGIPAERLRIINDLTEPVRLRVGQKLRLRK